jgi:hypothetical protein
MATSYAIRSFRNALLAIVLVASLTTACKKSGIGGGDVDPRDQYVGTYDGGYQASNLINYQERSAEPVLHRPDVQWCCQPEANR